jgi:hypothetical protein
VVEVAIEGGGCPAGTNLCRLGGEAAKRASQDDVDVVPPEEVMLVRAELMPA